MTTNILFAPGQVSAASIPSNHPQQHRSDYLLNRKQTVEAIVTVTEWLDESTGYCECPGKHLHSTPDGHQDCKVYLDPVPTLHCFHQGCSGVVEEWTYTLRRALWHPSACHALAKKVSGKANRAKLRQDALAEQVRRRAQTSLGRILREHRWTYHQICADSPVPVAENIADHWKILVGGFGEDDQVWIGDTYDSGMPHHAQHFKTRRQWLECPCPLGPFVSSAGFKPGSFSRSNESVARPVFLVVESDILSRDEVGAVFHWLAHECSMSLRYIVDTGGKSLHSWWDYPEPRIVDELKLILPELKCDRKMFGISQPARLPGLPRGDRFQKLIYCEKGVSL
jgi:hypothetical protein